jgi:uncharacterized membrane protein
VRRKGSKQHWRRRLKREARATALPNELQEIAAATMTQRRHLLRQRVARQKLQFQRQWRKAEATERRLRLSFRL